MASNFYVYAFLDPRKTGFYSYEDFSFKHEPFYIGKGRDNRDKEHFRPSEMNRNYNPHKNRKIKKILRDNLKTIIVRIATDLSEDGAHKLEIAAIKMIKRSKEGGPLTNIYDGGFGSTKSIETKKKISISLRKWYASHENTRVGQKRTQSQCSKISKAKLGKPRNPASVEKMRNTKLTTRRPPNTLRWILTSPTGEKFEVFGLGPFCKKHGLATSHLIAVAGGKRKHHKGWIAKKLG